MRTFEGEFIAIELRYIQRVLDIHSKKLGADIVRMLKEDLLQIQHHTERLDRGEALHKELPDVSAKQH